MTPHLTYRLMVPGSPEHLNAVAKAVSRGEQLGRLLYPDLYARRAMARVAEAAERARDRSVA